MCVAVWQWRVGRERENRVSVACGTRFGICMCGTSGICMVFEV